ncbi:MAG: hypothetical protein WCT16_02215 [Candidatus Buchananbacteria bacterium]
MNKLDKLNMNVTAAIGKVIDAQRELANAELAIANETSPASMEGRIARRGAIMAARDAGLDDRVKELLKTFLAESGVDEKFSAELKALASK